jgi:G:T-mismatch repair DNA endonuclease (very short patch repair protein)
MKCIICGRDHDGSYGKSGKYCSKKCRYTFTPEHKERISNALKGMEKPYLMGINNPNFGGKWSHDPEVYKRFREAVKCRGQGWTKSVAKNHSIVMKGNSNWMRGKHHTEETKHRIREKILSDFASGRRKLNKTMVSLPEKEIAKLLFDMGHDVKMGVRIENRLYDMFVADKNLIVEFNGDYWHMNPQKYSPDSYNKACNMIASEIWERDREKIGIAEKHGYRVCCIWEADYKKAKNKMDFLREVVS